MRTSKKNSVKRNAKTNVKTRVKTRAKLMNGTSHAVGRGPMDIVLSIKRRPHPSMKEFMKNAKATHAEYKAAGTKVAGLYPSFAVQSICDYGCAILRKSGKAYDGFKLAFDALMDVLEITGSVRNTYLHRVLSYADKWASVYKRDAYKLVYKASTAKQIEKMKDRAKYDPNKSSNKKADPFNPILKPRESAAKFAAQVYAKAYKYSKATEKDEGVCKVWLELLELQKSVVLKLHPAFKLSDYENLAE